MFKHARERKGDGLPKSASNYGAVGGTGSSVITVSRSEFQKSTAALVHRRRAVTFHSGVDASVWVAASVSRSPLFTLCFRKFSRGLGSVAPHARPNLWNASVPFAPQTCVRASTSLQEATALFFFFAPLRWHRHGCLSDFKCHPVTRSDVLMAGATAKNRVGDIIADLHCTFRV